MARTLRASLAPSGGESCDWEEAPYLKQQTLSGYDENLTALCVQEGRPPHFTAMGEGGPGPLALFPTGKRRTRFAAFFRYLLLGGIS